MHYQAKSFKAEEDIDKFGYTSNLIFLIMVDVTGYMKYGDPAFLLDRLKQRLGEPLTSR